MKSFKATLLILPLYLTTEGLSYTLPLCTQPSGCSTTPSSRSRTFLEMGKGKGVPAQMRGNYKRAKEMSSMREQMMAATKPGADGLPVFNLFVRSKKAKVWYPAGSFKGDEKSTAL